MPKKRDDPGETDIEQLIVDIANDLPPAERDQIIRPPHKPDPEKIRERYLIAGCTHVGLGFGWFFGLLIGSLLHSIHRQAFASLMFLGGALILCGYLRIHETQSPYPEFRFPWGCTIIAIIMIAQFFYYLLK